MVWFKYPIYLAQKVETQNYGKYNTHVDTYTIK
jgi:hypothetical protein